MDVPLRAEPPGGSADRRNLGYPGATSGAAGDATFDNPLMFVPSDSDDAIRRVAPTRALARCPPDAALRGRDAVECNATPRAAKRWAEGTVVMQWYEAPAKDLRERLAEPRYGRGGSGRTVRAARAAWAARAAKAQEGVDG